MHPGKNLRIAAAVAGVALAVVIASAFDMPWRTADGGGGEMSGGAWSLSGTVGQADPGPVMSGGYFSLTGGFWAATPVSAPPDCPGDLDGDNDVDQADLGILLAAYNLNGGGDLDGDGDTDQADLGILLAAYGMTC